MILINNTTTIAFLSGNVPQWECVLFFFHVFGVFYFLIVKPKRRPFFALFVPRFLSSSILTLIQLCRFFCCCFFNPEIKLQKKKKKSQIPKCRVEIDHNSLRRPQLQQTLHLSRLAQVPPPPNPPAAIVPAVSLIDLKAAAFPPVDCVVLRPPHHPRRGPAAAW